MRGLFIIGFIILMICLFAGTDESTNRNQEEFSSTIANIINRVKGFTDKVSDKVGK